jgi:predicted DNA-binding helix-hairpin-helix protein
MAEFREDGSVVIHEDELRARLGGPIDWNTAHTTTYARELTIVPSEETLRARGIIAETARQLIRRRETQMFHYLTGGLMAALTSVEPWATAEELRDLVLTFGFREHWPDP